jgi:TRAP-type mannitol/chloroaromatic compound transport system permease small subunit
MQSVLKGFVSIIDTISDWAGRSMIVFFISMLCFMVYEVVSRYFFENPTVWGMEATTMAWGVFALIPGAYTMLSDDHIRVDILYIRWTPRTKAWINVLTFPLILVFCIAMLWQTSKFGWDSFSSREHSVSAWGPPIYHWKMVPALATLLMILQGLSTFIRNLTKAITGRELQ